MPQSRKKKYADFDRVTQAPRRKYADFEQLTAPPTPQPPEPPGFLENLQIGAERGYRKYIDPALAATGEVIEGLTVGDPRPALRMGESAIRGTVEALRSPQQATPVRDPQTGTIMDLRTPPPRDSRITELAQQRQARYQATPEYQYSQQRLAALNERAALDPSKLGKATRGTSEFLTGAAPTLAAAVASRGSLPVIGMAAAAQSAAQPEMIGPNVAAGTLPVPIGQAFRAGVNAVRRALGKGAAQIVEAEARPAAAARVRESIGEAPPVTGETISAPAQPAASIQTVFTKLETDNVEQIGAMIANANRRFRKSSTPAERQSSWDDYKRLNQLTPDEQRALGQVLPARTVSPVGEFAEGGYSREIRDIPMSEPNPQLDANLRELEQFFGGQRTAAAAAPATAAIRPVSQSTMRTMPAHSLKPGDVIEYEVGVPARTVRGEVARVQFDPDLETMVPVVRAGNTEIAAVEYLEGGRVVSPMAPRASAETGPPALSAEFGVSAATPSARAASASVTGPSASAPLDALNVAISDAAKSTPRAQRAKDELLGLLGASKSLRSTADVSYPLRQGALLLLRPLQWRQAKKVWTEMFRAFRTKNFDAIKQAIETHPLTARMDAAGLQRFPQAGEEAFGRRAGSKVSEIVSKTPIIKQSGQAYDAAAATQRVQAFEQYARLIDKAGLTAEEALKADKAAAQWINIATGRGSLGRFDKAFEGLNFFFFSPRYVASRLNVFNPAMYIRNALSPGGKVVLKQQMSDLMQFAGVVATTMYLAKQAGADVNLHINSPDFLKIRFGDWRYDTLAGLQQVMRLIYRVGADIGRAAQGEKPKPGQTAIDIGETFLNYKLSPPAGVFRDFINQRTVDKKPFTAGRAIADLTAPMQWADFVEAYQKEAWGGVAKTSFGATGIGVQNYEQDPVDAAIERSQPLFSELQRLNKRVSELRRKDGEKDDAFNARVQQFGQNYTLYGQRLLSSPRFQQAPDALKAVALDGLNERAKEITHREFAFPKIELDPNIIMDAAESSAAKAKGR